MFLDTNVLVSTFATCGLCADLYEWLLTEHEVLIGQPVIAEVMDIFQRKFRVSDELLVKAEAELRLLRVIPAQAVAPSLPIRDVDDPWIIPCAMQAGVDCFVTGDAELLALKMVGNLPIVLPRVCWEQLSN